MKYFALVLLAAFAQPLLPLPRQAINEHAEHTHKKPAEANKRKQATDPADSAGVGVDGETNTYNTYNFASDTHPEPAKQSDPWTKGYTLTAIYDVLTALLVVVAAGTGWAVWKQTIETRKAAEAALLNAKAVINAERPWMLVEYEWQKVEKLEGIGFYAINKGETPAEIVEAYFESQILPYISDNLPVPPNYKSPIFIPRRGDNLIVKEEKWGLNPVPIHPESWIDNCMKRDAVESAREFVYFYGVIVYRDMLHESTAESGLHYTRFCFCYDVFMKALLPTGPQDYRQKK
jgi:hypothetical protein